MDEIQYQFEYPTRIPSVFIGAGGHSFRNVLPAMQYAPVDLRAVCDLKLDRAEAYARIFGAPEAYTDYREMLEKEKPTAAFIVTDHKPDEDGLVRATAIAADCLRAGVNVWMEKPTAASTAEIRELMRLSEESGAILVTGMNKIFMPSIQKAKQIISTPEFGRVTSVYARYPLGLPDEEGRRIEDLEMTMGFRDHVYHVGAVMNYLGGPISRISYEWEAINHSTVASVLFESGAILLYLAEKTGQFIPQDAAQRYETIQWLMWQMGGVGPMFGQLGFFHKFAGKDYEDKRPRDRYVAESKRLLGVLNQRLEGRAWIMGDAYTIADIAIFPWVRNLIERYEAGDLVGMQDFPHVTRALAAFVARPEVVRGLAIPGRS